MDQNPNYIAEASSPMLRSPNPNNPMEYCSVIPPYQQVGSSSSTPISVMVPVGILKRGGKLVNEFYVLLTFLILLKFSLFIFEGPKTQRKEKNVMFSDGLRPNL